MDIDAILAQIGFVPEWFSPASIFVTKSNVDDAHKRGMKVVTWTVDNKEDMVKMIDAGVDEGDILVIDKSLEPQDGDMAVCFVDGEFTLKRLCFTEGGLKLVPANPNYPEIEISEGVKFIMWGVVTYVIKKVR
jgi:DNA polymerase V